MTAGRGIVHSEMPCKTDKLIHGLQLWINLPRRHKMCEPQYQELRDQEIPRATTPSRGVTIKIIAGESQGIKSPVRTRTPTMYLDFKMKKNESAEQTIPKTYTGFLYVLSGTIYVSDKGFQGNSHHTLTLSEDGAEVVRFKTNDINEAHFVFIVGEPLKVPIVQHGPFVMNTKEEIYNTFIDYQYGMNGFERAVEWRSTMAKKIKGQQNRLNLRLTGNVEIRSLELDFDER